jgi:hypothetical protein
MRILLRLIFRLGTWVLAALGIKALYDRVWPKAQQYRQPAAEVLDTAKTAAHEVVGHAKTAATEVATEAQTRFSDVKNDTAGQPVHDEEMDRPPSAADRPSL